MDYNVTNSSVDKSQLSEIAKEAKETLGVKKIDALADKGFFNCLEIKKCVDNGITPYVPEQSRYGVGQTKVVIDTGPRPSSTLLSKLGNQKLSFYVNFRAPRVSKDANASSNSSFEPSSTLYIFLQSI